MVRPIFLFPFSLSFPAFRSVPLSLSLTGKSTEGWSIFNIICDFTGGMLSMLQMGLQYYNMNGTCASRGSTVGAECQPFAAAASSRGSGCADDYVCVWPPMCWLGSVDITIIVGNPVKLGLAMISVVFDILFMVQHYALYSPGRQTRYVCCRRDAACCRWVHVNGLVGKVDAVVAAVVCVCACVCERERVDVCVCARALLVCGSRLI